MSDLQMEITPDGGDLVLENQDLALDLGLQTAVLVSLFTDRRRVDGDPEADHPDEDPRGWWGETPGDAFGSGLWLLPAKITARTLGLARGYVDACVQWMKREGIAGKIGPEGSAKYPAYGLRP